MPTNSTLTPLRPAAGNAVSVAIPRYLEDTYWWAYVHPLAVRIFERQWLVNLILWGNFGRLRDAALRELGDSLPGHTLQVACVYGDLTSRLSTRVADGGSLDVVDVLEVQLRNLQRKLPGAAPVSLIQRDSAALGFENAKYDRALLFFLLHEQPESVRRRTLAEALRVVKPGGKLVVVDYHRPHRWNPIARLSRPLLRRLEPFALDLWRHEIAEWLPASARITAMRKTTYFGGLYQKLVIVC
jgi:ubiquinone/menaquinone biosynthesis C-methylase UbiE